MKKLFLSASLLIFLTTAADAAMSVGRVSITPRVSSMPRITSTPRVTTVPKTSVPQIAPKPTAPFKVGPATPLYQTPTTAPSTGWLWWLFAADAIDDAAEAATKETCK